MGRKWTNDMDQNQPMPVTVRFEGADGAVLAEARFEVFASLNYAVHRLFGHHAGDGYVPTTLTSAAGAKLAASTATRHRPSPSRRV